jgi:hypothetical protein
VTSECLAEQDLPDDGSVPVGHDELVVELHEGQEGLGGRRHDVDLFLRCSHNAFGVDRIPADSDQHSGGSVVSLVHYVSLPLYLQMSNDLGLHIGGNQKSRSTEYIIMYYMSNIFIILNSAFFIIAITVTWW